ncbi:MAG: hypothetical protein WB630_16235 [Candidatus Acidiferrales bacterium]
MNRPRIRLTLSDYGSCEPIVRMTLMRHTFQTAIAFVNHLGFDL